MNANLNNRPSADKISFAPECFAQVGIEETFSVVTGFPNVKRFTTLADAEAYSTKTGLPVSVGTQPIMRRIRWN